MKKKKRMEKGHIEQRGENKYLVRWRVDRKQVGKIVEGDYARALAFLAEQLNPKPAEPPKMSACTFGSFVENEWAQYVRENWKESTQITEGSYVKRRIRPYFEDMLLSQIKPVNILAFHRKMEDEGLGRATRRNLHAILGVMFSYALEQELIEGNPVKKRRRSNANGTSKTSKPVLNERQLQQLLTVVPIRYKAFYMVLALTGVRSGECLGLKWADIDFAGSQLHIQRAIYRGKETTPKTESSIRTRPMTAELQKALLNHKAMSHYTTPADYVFASSSGRPLNPDQLREALQSSLKKIGVHFDQPRANGMHLLRHSSGSIVYSRTGGDVKTTQEWLGHSSSRITLETYVHPLTDQQRKAAAGLEGAIFSQPEPSVSREPMALRN